MNPHDHIEDAEFEDFLKGEGDLARQLQGLRQPPVPEALSVAILARAAADLGDAARPGVPANDAVHDEAPAVPPAQHYLRRARVPLGIAASVVLALFVVRGLMPQAFAPEVRQESVVQESPSPAVKMAEVAPTPAAKEASVDAKVAVAEPVPQPPAPQLRPRMPKSAASRAAVPVADIVVAAAPVVMPPLGFDAGEATAKVSTPESLEVDSVTLASGPLARVAKPAAPKSLSYAAAPSLALRAAAPPAMAAIAPAHAPTPEPLPAPMWLVRMEDMLKAGQTKEAHAEWLKFRARYPNAEVPPELQRQLETVN